MKMWVLETWSKEWSKDIVTGKPGSGSTGELSQLGPGVLEILSSG